DNSPVPIEKFTDSFNIKHLSYEPIYKFSNIITRDGKNYISFNREKFIGEKKAKFPDILEWSKPLLNKLKLKEE
ncbi:MAG: hypothetical protein ACFFDY_05010, partial [Candidatus Thorarchaeota archaeon]